MKVSKATVIRTVVLILALVNQILASTGHSVIPIDNELVTELLSLFMTVGAALWAWWKNNSFTKAAIKADAVLKQEKEKNA